jgi:glycosyltransferase involved in cell wall biosynthesis
MMFTRADHITAISNYLAKWAKRMGAKANVTVIPNGVDVGNFQFPRLPIGGQAISNFQTSPDVQKQEIKQRLGLKPEDKVVITTSRLVEKNGVGDLIEAMRYLPENIKLLILGTGNLESNLKLKTSNLQLTGRVAFLGYIAHEKLPEYLHASDIFVRASRSEGLGISFLEAMAAGVPVVATPVGGIPDFLFSAREDILPSPARENRGVRKTNPAPTKDERVSRIGTSPMGEARVRMSSGAGVDRYGETGLFCRVGDPKDIAEKMKLLLTNDELRNRIVENASKVVKERYEWGKIAKQMEAVLDKNTPRV